MRGASLQSLLVNASDEVFTPRTANQPLDNRLRDISDIANTAKNYLESCVLIIRDAVDRRYRLNPEAEDYYRAARDRAHVFLPNPDHEEFAAKFEEATCTLLRDGLRLKADLTSNRKRPHGEKGGYADIVIFSPDGQQCMIVDTKAIQRYSLPSSDYAKMVSNYSENFAEISGKDVGLAGCLYVAASLSDSFAVEAAKLKRDAGIFCSGITAKDLLMLVQNGLKPEESWSRLLQGGRVRAD